MEFRFHALEFKAFLDEIEIGDVVSLYSQGYRIRLVGPPANRIQFPA